MALLHPGDQLDNACLDRGVERGCRLVGNDQPRIAREGQGNEHALTHAARELMRVATEQLRRVPQLRCGERGKRALAPFRAWADAEAGQMLVELPANGEHGIKRAQRGLWNEGNGTAEQGAPLPRTQAEERFALEPQLAGGDRKTRRKQLGDRTPDHGFSRARFADEAEDAARGERE